MPENGFSSVNHSPKEDDLYDEYNVIMGNVPN